MDNEFVERTDTISVPANTGVDGFVHTIRELLKRPRLQEIRIDARGKVTYRRFVREDQTDNVGIAVDFGDVQPAGIIRNSDVVELTVKPGSIAPVIIGSMFDVAAQEQMHPVGLVGGADTIFWDWYRVTTGSVLHSRTRVFGLPFYTDRLIPDTALILCAGYGRDSAMVDTQKAYKVEMEYDLVKPPSTDVEIL